MSLGRDTFRGSGTMSGDTFRGSANSTLSRTQLYSKNSGDIDVNRNGLVRTESPISNNLLVSVSSVNSAVHDPISGTTLVTKNGQAQVTAPSCKQPFMYSRKFRLEKDIDITINQLRTTTKVSRYTNEKVGTAGTPTGMDRALTSFKQQ